MIVFEKYTCVTLTHATCGLYKDIPHKTYFLTNLYFIDSNVSMTFKIAIYSGVYDLIYALNCLIFEVQLDIIQIKN